MKKITYFYEKECPYCAKANRLIDELISENPEYAQVEMERIEEGEHPEIIANYDYYSVPCTFIGNDKQFEAYLFIPDAEIKEGFRKTFEEALR